MNIAFLISSIIMLGAFTQGLTGFGLALVSVPLLSMIIDVKIGIPVAGIFGWLVTFPIVWKMREHVKWKIGIILFIGSIPGSFLGADLLKRLPASIILVTMGIVLVLSSLYSFYTNKRLNKESPSWLTLMVGFFSGALGSSVGEPGPPAIAYNSLQPWSSDQTKSTLVFFFMLQMVGAITGFWHKGLLTSDVFDNIVKALPGFMIGMTLGMFGYKLLNHYKINYHRIVHTLLLMVGIILIFKNVS